MQIKNQQPYAAVLLHLAHRVCFPLLVYETRHTTLERNAMLYGIQCTSVWQLWRPRTMKSRRSLSRTLHNICNNSNGQKHNSHAAKHVITHVTRVTILMTTQTIYTQVSMAQIGQGREARSEHCCHVQATAVAATLHAVWRQSSNVRVSCPPKQ